MPMDYERRFGGIARLYGQSGLERFAAAHICVVGIGGVGSWVAEALARSGVGGMTLIDLDNVAESNVNRQIHALEDQFGRAKVDAMADRILAINPDCRVTRIEEFVELDNLDQLLTADFDYVVDCIDAYKTKAALIAHCRRNKIRLITVGGAGGQTDPLKVRLTDLYKTQHDPLLAKTRKLLRKEYGFSSNPKRKFDLPCVYSDEQQVYPDGKGAVCSEKPAGGTQGSGLHCGGFGSAMTVTSTFAMVATAHVLKKLSGGKGL
ncbi:MAG: tRNA cyclic N6-threonylcarbamoyladenosine(37) synthase TcdA [Sedimenticola selenatireducens]|uniref:tRNA cyclic N6-threonylcarbamoyladenosine(37) synthase TcdA n=2 Tax=Sedimenticola selenatireducens TaxID=191960 RepID=A0A558DM34_9GAMM|nr:tRNA cyclic N6-threonylcarbamoyladenosine(37) synthase TcdA [Sedimenticola selenatireducens]TVO78672.1 tRNA cyclic N6-threonylcarbamoyladenosine(37) synthase TcdA [Sedimenticola selenatireducens]TVT62034.1 MAG: tRNA cyclic N6-threonylcarbamoyladenosine(37) synthase TcdA [Sedimenticola selenatireducens]